MSKTVRVATSLLPDLLGNGTVIEKPTARIRVRSDLQESDKLVGVSFDGTRGMLVMEFENDEDLECSIEGEVTIPPSEQQCGKCGTPLRGPWVSMAACETEDRARARRLEALMAKIERHLNEMADNKGGRPDGA